MDYKVITSSKSEDLENMIRESIQHGWEPYGSLNVISSPDKDVLFIQAMIKDPLPDREMSELIHWFKKQNRILESMYNKI